ncbi:hypothetical protein C1H46_030696 [Malus baccata]|uniref:Uncharacterized protein n=1 Tax=Malus baccata TaxID=106549 RepID=A0A540LBK4_MALBA|nr:hypothetical protein C1H46_030696 [Malus baccata]
MEVYRCRVRGGGPRQLQAAEEDEGPRSTGLMVVQQASRRCGCNAGNGVVMQLVLEMNGKCADQGKRIGRVNAWIWLQWFRQRCEATAMSGYGSDF